MSGGEQARAQRPEAARRLLLARALVGLAAAGVLALWAEEAAARWLSAGVLGLAAVWALERLRRPAPPEVSPALIPLAGAALWGPVQWAAGATVDPAATLRAALSWWTLLAVVWLALEALAEREVLERALEWLLWFGFLLCAVSTLCLFTSGGRVFWIVESGYRDRVAGPFVYWNNYAAFIETLLPAALVRALGEARWPAPAAMAAVFYASMVASGSRAGTVIAGAETALVLALWLRRPGVEKRGALARAAALGGLLAGATAAVGVERLLARFGQPDPYAGRRELLEASLEMARARPWLGWGLGSWPSVYPAYARFDPGSRIYMNHAHNDWAEWAAEGGWPLAGLLGALALWSVPAALRSVWGVGVPAVLTHAALDYPTARLPLAVWIFLLLGALAAWRKREAECWKANRTD
jgi:O-antigen ligase